MKHEQALAIATHWVKKLQPYCDRIEIAGSIRRRKPEVKDIELVCIPKNVPIDTLFASDTRTMRHPGFAQELQNQEVLTVIKGNAHTGKYTQVRLDEHNIKMDVFTAVQQNWGHILAIRTGPAEYSHKVLAIGWTMKGYQSEDGILKARVSHDQGKTIVWEPVAILEEKDLFDLIGIPYVEPSKRFDP